MAQLVDKPIEENRTKLIRALLVIVLSILAVLFSLSQGLDQLQDVVRRSGWPGLLLAIGVYAVLGASPIPSEPLTLIISATFNPFIATFVASVGNVLAALFEYAVGRNIGDATNMEKWLRKLPFGLGKLPFDSPLFLIGARVLPGYGPKIVSLISGAYHVSLWRFIWTSWIAALIGGAVISFGTYGLLSLPW
ncbi:MAG: VTT domain-containing protein [Chloroflexi bacterium]|nr:VTT domain-containing protein [Chloroflexota bacterium]